MIYPVEAVLLAVRDWRDADRLVTLFSKEQGKLTAVAYGARRPSNRLAGSIQPFAYLDLQLQSGTGMEVIKQCEVKNHFRPVREELTSMSYASFLTELVIELCPERQPEPLLFDILLDAFSLMRTRNPRIVALAAAWKIVEISGYVPEWQVCVACGQALQYPAFFDAGAGGAACSVCSSRELQLDKPAVELINTLLELDFKQPEDFSVTGAALVQAEAVLVKYLLYCLDKPLKSLGFIRQLHAVNRSRSASTLSV
ncbi:DNA repair protein RecO [Propionispora hippei]|uniref:DNA repair protein RecO n=1 Tax=Propionispora hippei DSM 15287 TaxID=1123003 RepID=A0A1M6ANC2_9FIRM|nr:DNA repair protein RecO [Propionispora hippei]SHI37931.1 DNA replication and repair protein RecO [Propionispora hippei DSM 15287]